MKMIRNKMRNNICSQYSIVSLLTFTYCLILCTSSSLSPAGRWVFPSTKLQSLAINKRDRPPEMDKYSDRAINETLRSFYEDHDPIVESNLYSVQKLLLDASDDQQDSQQMASMKTEHHAGDDNFLMPFFQMINKERHYSNEESRNEARDDIKQTFKKYGLETYGQKFKAHDRNHTSRSGINIIGIWPSKNRHLPGDKIILVGGHYDTVKGTTGIDDNGSGTVALLQLAKKLGTIKPVLDHTIFLVAFDLEEDGLLGSKAFVTKYLIPNELKERKSVFLGAYVTDMVLHWDNATNSQTISESFMKTVPKAVTEIKANGNRGDFACVWMRRKEDEHMWQAFKTSFFKLGAKKKGINTIAFDPVLPFSSTPIIGSIGHGSGVFLRSDHASFWYHKIPEIPTLDAVLITDLGPWRTLLKHCYHRACDNISQITPEKLAFLNHIIDTLWDVITRNVPKKDTITGVDGRSINFPRWSSGRRYNGYYPPRASSDFPFQYQPHSINYPFLPYESEPLRSGRDENTEPFKNRNERRESFTSTNSDHTYH